MFPEAGAFASGPSRKVEVFEDQRESWWYCMSMLRCAALLLLSGCVATVTPIPSRAIAAAGPPPAPLSEQVPPAPTVEPNATPSSWQPGYWHWNGVDYAWIPGHWETRRAGMTWSQPRYWSEGGRSLYVPGKWVKP
jgi:hypothetical protein